MSSSYNQEGVKIEYKTHGEVGMWPYDKRILCLLNTKECKVPECSTVWPVYNVEV